MVFMHHDKVQDSQNASGLSMGLGLKNPQTRHFSTDPAGLEGEIRSLAQDREALHNMVVFDSGNSLGDIIQQCFALPAALTKEVSYRKGHATVVHHSRSHPKPILQCVNYPVWE